MTNNRKRRNKKFKKESVINTQPKPIEVGDWVLPTNVQVGKFEPYQVEDIKDGKYHISTNRRMLSTSNEVTDLKN